MRLCRPIVVVAAIATALIMLGCGRDSRPSSSLWQRLPPCPPVDAAMHSLAFTDALHGFSTGFLARGLYATADGGQTWETSRGKIVGAAVEQRLPSHVDKLRYVITVAAVGGDAYLAYDGTTHHLLSSPPQAGSGVLVSRDHGHTWRGLLALPSRTGCVLQVTGLDRRHLWVLCGNVPVVPRESWLLRTTDGGRSWSRVWQARLSGMGVPPSGPPQDLASVRFLDERTGWALADGRPVRTADGGATWVWAAPEDVAGDNIVAVDARHLWTAYGYSEESGVGGGVWSSADAGRTWSEQSKFKDVPVWGLFFTSPDRGWVVSADGLFETRDGGAHWEYETDAANLGNSYLNLVRGGGRLYAQSGDAIMTRKVD